MDTMALLLSTDDWSKLPIQKQFADNHGLSVWRTRGRYKKFLEGIPFPVNLYFFHESVIGYSCRCTHIDLISRTETGCTLTRYDNSSLPPKPTKLTGLAAAQGYRLEDVPPDFRNDPDMYRLFFTIDKIAEISDTHISHFPKWKKPGEFHDRGQLGMFKVVDIFAK